MTTNNIAAAYNSVERALLGTAALHKLIGDDDFISSQRVQSGRAFFYTADNDCEVSSIGD